MRDVISVFISDDNWSNKERSLFGIGEDKTSVIEDIYSFSDKIVLTEG